MDLAAAVIAGGPAVNAADCQIDQECNPVLVRRQPAAGGLRLVLTVIKVLGTDLRHMSIDDREAWIRAHTSIPA